MKVYAKVSTNLTTSSTFLTCMMWAISDTFGYPSRGLIKSRFDSNHMLICAWQAYLSRIFLIATGLYSNSCRSYWLQGNPTMNGLVLRDVMLSLHQPYIEWNDAILSTGCVPIDWQHQFIVSLTNISFVMYHYFPFILSVYPSFYGQYLEVCLSGCDQGFLWILFDSHVWRGILLWNQPISFLSLLICSFTSSSISIRWNTSRTTKWICNISMICRIFFHSVRR